MTGVPPKGSSHERVKNRERYSSAPLLSPLAAARFGSDSAMRPLERTAVTPVQLTPKSSFILVRAKHRCRNGIKESYQLRWYKCARWIPSHHSIGAHHSDPRTGKRYGTWHEVSPTRLRWAMAKTGPFDPHWLVHPHRISIAWAPRRRERGIRQGHRRCPSRSSRDEYAGSRGRADAYRRGRPAIAVLPFINLSGDPDPDYLADGMVEEIVTSLSRFDQLRRFGRAE